MSNCLWPHGLQHTRPPCPSPTPGVCSNSCLLRVGDAVQTSHPLLSPSPPAFNLSQHQGLSMSQFFTSGGQSIGVSAPASVLPMNAQAWSPLGWTGWISLQSKGLSRVFSSTTVKSINSSVLSFLYSPTLSDPMDCSPPGSSVRGIFQARALEWGAIQIGWFVLLLFWGAVF